MPSKRIYLTLQLVHGAWISDDATQLFDRLPDNLIATLSLILVLTFDDSQRKTFRFSLITEKSYETVFKSFFEVLCHQTIV